VTRDGLPDRPLAMPKRDLEDDLRPDDGEWYQFRVRAAQASGRPIPLQSDDLRGRLVGFVAGVLDLFLGFTFVLSFWR
jgi:hypothetical protein